MNKKVSGDTYHIALAHFILASRASKDAERHAEKLSKELGIKRFGFIEDGIWDSASGGTEEDFIDLLEKDGVEKGED